MSFTSNPEIEKLKIIYYEIVSGFTFIPSINIFIRHFSDLDNIDIAQTKQLFFSNYVKDGIPSYKDRLKVLEEIGDWTPADEENINFLRTVIIDNEKNLPTMTMRDKVIPEQQEFLKKIIKERKEDLAEALIKKRQIIGATAEEFAEKDTINFLAYKALYKDFGHNRLFKSMEEFQDLSDDESDKYIDAMDSSMDKFTEENIRKIASMPFFINIFSYVKDNVTFFFQKPMVELTNYQFLLVSLGSRNLTVLQNSKHEPPEIISDDDINKLVDFYDQEYSILMGKRHVVKTNQNKVVTRI